MPRRPERPAIPHLGRLALAVATACVALGARGGPVWAQADLRNITQPIPVVNTGGHSAPVRALIFPTRDGSRLLSGGLDKIVNVWGLEGPRPGLLRTIRPRIWRGYAGAVNALALAPVADARGQRLLAVAGFGVMSNRGEIGLFRFPGLDHASTGEVDSQLAGGAPDGHSNSVTCLAFDPRGEFLASGSNDATVRIWRLATRKTEAVLAGHSGPVNALAYTSDGRRLLTGGADGRVKLWDVPRGTLLLTANPNPLRQRRGDPAGDAINTLAVGPDGRAVVIGRENGDLVRYDVATLGKETLLPRGGNGRGAVEALAISHDGTRLVTSVVARLTPTAERPRVECDVELRTWPQGAITARLARTTNLVYAFAFSPDDRRLAFSGRDVQASDGLDTQAITVRHLGDPNRGDIILSGQGSTLWDVGFSRDSRAVGFARKRPDDPGPPPSYEDFDLQGRRVAPFDRAELSRALETFEGWTVRPVDPYTLDILNGQGRGHRLKLDPLTNRRWWSFSFLPPNPGHPRPTFAVGCEAGVLIYRLEDGVRTRVLAGHNGPVTALAPSPDGVWLVTGSSDQTVRFWRLAGCDVVAPLGARFVPDGPGRFKVAGVERRGFAEAMGMERDDVVEEFYIDAKKRTDVAALEVAPPQTRLEFVVRRRGARVLLNTTKREAPALTLFPSLDREWVLWTPRGLYDTSAIGDRRYLGWHRNRLLPAEPTDYFAFDNFEKELRRPLALGRFLESGDPAALDPVPGPAQGAGRGPEQVVAEDLLPRVQVAAPGRVAFEPLAVAGAVLPVRVRAVTEDGVPGRGLIRSLTVLVDSGRATEMVFNPPVPEVNRVVAVNLNPGPHTLSVVAVNDLDKQRTESLDLVAPEPVRPIVAEPPQLVVLAIGTGEFGGGDPALPRIPFAAADARDVGAFLGAPGGSPRYRRIDVQPILGPDATSAKILGAFERLEERRVKGDLGQGDSVFVLVESHFLDFDAKGVILGSDATSPGAPAPAVDAGRVADLLGRLADYGCTVMILIDTLHEERPAPPRTNRVVNEWARALYRKNVIAFVASIHGPSRSVTSRGHGAFALGILDSLNVQGRGRLATKPAGAFTLLDFQDRVVQNVQSWTDRRQHARCYVPETIPGRLPIFDPPSRIQPKALQAANP